MSQTERTFVFAAGFAAFALVTFILLASVAQAQTMGEYGATVGSTASTTGSMGGSIGGSTGGSGGLNMGVATGSFGPDVVNGQGPSRTIVIGGSDRRSSAEARSANRSNNTDEDDEGPGGDWAEIR